MKNLIKLFFVLFVLVNGLFSFISCEKELDNQNENRALLKNSLKSSLLLSLDDATIKMLANKHNEYLEIVLKNYNYTFDEDKVINCRNNFLNIDLPGLTMEDKLTIVEGFKNKNGEFVPTTSEKFYNVLRVADLPNEDDLVEFIKEVNESIVNSNLVYSKLELLIDGNLADVNGRFTEAETKILKIYFETLKASAYFWFPQEYGGLGTGDRHLTKIHGKSSYSTGQIIAEVCFADCMDLAFGFTVLGFGGPVGWGLLVGSAVYSSALAGIF